MLATTVLAFLALPAAPQLDFMPSLKEGVIAAGGNATEGNSDTLDVNLTVDGVVRMSAVRATLSGFWNFGEADSELDTTRRKHTNEYGGGAKLDYFLTDGFYLVGNSSFEVDDLANLDLRSILGVGIGYQFFESSAFDWNIESGLSYLLEEFSDDTETDYVGARVASNMGLKLSRSARFDSVGEVLPSIEDEEDFYMRWDNRLQVDVTGSWILQVQYVYGYDNTPAAGSKRAEQRLAFSLGWRFGQ